MFGLFRKKPPKGAAEAALAVMPEAVTNAAILWDQFCRDLPFKAEVPLVDRINAFLQPYLIGARKRFPVLENSPDSMILLIVAKGIVQSGTHSNEEVAEALRLPYIPE